VASAGVFVAAHFGGSGITNSGHLGLPCVATVAQTSTSQIDLWFFPHSNSRNSHDLTVVAKSRSNCWGVWMPQSNRTGLQTAQGNRRRSFVSADRSNRPLLGPSWPAIRKPPTSQNKTPPIFGGVRQWSLAAYRSGYVPLNNTVTKSKHAPHRPLFRHSRMAICGIL
jgi:hypothetical protein